MSLKERISSVLVVSAAGNCIQTLYEYLPEEKYSPIYTVSNISAAKRAVCEQSFVFVVINSPLPDDAGVRFAIDASTIRHAVVLLLVRSELYEAVFDKVMEQGIFVLSKPTSRSFLMHALDWMEVVKERERLHEKKTHSLEDKMAEIKLVNRAKIILMEQSLMDEAQAHRCIEKQAMDRCVSKRVIAEEIIKKHS